MAKKNKTFSSQLKAKPRKDNAVFKIAGHKVGKKNKGKAKAVTTTLKKLERKVQTDMKTEKANAAYDDVREKMLEKQKQPEKKEKYMAVEKDDLPPADLDAAAMEFAKL